MTLPPTHNNFSWEGDETKRRKEKPSDSVASQIQRKLQAANHGFGGFSDSLLKTLRVLEYHEANRDTRDIGGPSPALLLLKFEVTPDLCNDYLTLHGGAQATAIDAFTSILLAYVHRAPSVTADLHVSCVGAAPLGSTVYCICRAEKYGGALQFSSCDLYRQVPVNSTEDNNEKTKTRKVLVAKGLHTKYVLKKRVKGFNGKPPPMPPRSKL